MNSYLDVVNKREQLQEVSIPVRYLIVPHTYDIKHYERSLAHIKYDNKSYQFSVAKRVTRIFTD